MRLKVWFRIFFSSLILSSCIHKAYYLSKKNVRFTEESLNTTLKKHVDLVLVHTEGSEISQKDFFDEFQEAKSIFSKYGVNLNLISFYSLNIPESWQTLNADEFSARPNITTPNFYAEIFSRKTKLPQKTEETFKKILKFEKLASKTIYVIALNSVYMTIQEKNKKRKIEVGAFSFPPYIYEDRIPKKLRGVITIKRTNGVVLAHELGHKLINVTHEGKEVGPQSSGDKVPGLMGYADEVEVFGGKSGRWHRERLLLSPFIYQLKDGKKHWNADFQNHGGYFDQLYKGYIIK